MAASVASRAARCIELHRSRGIEGFKAPLDEHVTLQGIYRARLDTLLPSVEASATPDALRESAGSIYRSVRAWNGHAVSGATEITQTTPLLVNRYTERSIFISRRLS
jgi:hypothetical protein